MAELGRRSNESVVFERRRYNRRESDFAPCNMCFLFDAYMYETISDEQVDRVLTPILQMIREGKFNDPE